MRPLHQPTTQSRLRPFKPTHFGRYTLLMPLATGGMGEIFLARLEGVQGFEKLCVIKKILPHLTQEADFVTRFVNEAKTLVQLSHGSIAQVLDMGLHDGDPYLSLEFVDGKDLRKVATRARERHMPLPLTFILYTLSRVLDALAYAHRKRDDEEKEIGLVHRDVSPQNILISYEGEVKVIDFGLAKSTLNVARTNPSIVLGKFLYMSPEQARHAKVDRRTDLYSVGLCLYELVAGKNPFDDVPPGELLGKVSNPTIAPIQQVEALCPGSIAQVVAKALAVDPAQRFQTAEEFRGRLMAILLDIDANAGPESCSRFMREAFSNEYNLERKLLASLRDQRVSAPLPTAIRAVSPPGVKPLTAVTERESEALGSSRKETPTVVRNLSEIARRSMAVGFDDEKTPMPTEPRKLRPEPIVSQGLSFAPTARLKEDDRRATRVERETMPSIVVNPEPLTREASFRNEAVTSRELPQVADTPRETPAPIPSPAPVREAGSSPWQGSENETTMPGMVAFDPTLKDTQMSLPAVMTSEPFEVIEPATQPAVEGRRASLPAPVTAPLPAALKNRLPPHERTEVTWKTTRRGVGFLWVVIPLLALLAVAGFVLHDVYQEHLQTAIDEAQRNQKLNRPGGDGRSREVPTPPPEMGEPELEGIHTEIPEPDLEPLGKPELPQHGSPLKRKPRPH
jgi:serine/threonine protein kinase